MLQILCLHARLIAQVAVGGGGGQACQIGGGGWSPGMAGEHGTHQIAGVLHHLASDHSQAGGRHQTPVSSAFSASMTDTCHSASLPSLWQPSQLRRMMNRSTTGGGHLVLRGGKPASCSVGWFVAQLLPSENLSSRKRLQS